MLLHNTVVGRHAEIRKAIIDKHVVVPEGVKIGVDKEHDRARGFVVSPGGITVVGKGAVRHGIKRFALLTREYPPEVYGGAGVHVEYLAKSLAPLVDLTVHCQGIDRPDAVAHHPWGALNDQVLRVFSTDLSMAEAVAGADLVHSHTWYANLAGRLASLRSSVYPARRHDALPRAAAPVEGRAARRRVRAVVLGGAGGRHPRVGGGGGLRRHAG